MNEFAERRLKYDVEVERSTNSLSLSELYLVSLSSLYEFHLQQFDFGNIYVTHVSHTRGKLLGIFVIP